MKNLAKEYGINTSNFEDFDGFENEETSREARILRGIDEQEYMIAKARSILAEEEQQREIIRRVIIASKREFKEDDE